MKPLATQLIDAGLQKYAARLAELARPALKMRIARVGPEADRALSSKLGGTPDLPAGFEWPRWDKTPLAFIGQINLADLGELSAARALPAAGMLSFFYNPEQTNWGFDPNDRGSARVCWFPDVSELRRTSFPLELARHGRFNPGEISFGEVVTLPPYQARDVDALQFTAAEGDKYFELWQTWHAAHGDDRAHQLLGHPEPIQDEMQLQCQLVTNGIDCGGPEGYEDPRRSELEPGADDWQLLAQIDSDDSLGMMWGDVGMLYYWIRADDLRTRRFDQAWMIFQCM